MKKISDLRIAIVIPTYNEALHIEAVLESLCRQAPEQVEDIIVADGGSDDDTAAIVERFRLREPKVRLIHNPARLQAPGVNLAARMAAPGANVLVRIDAHAGYAQDFIERLLCALVESQADSVVVRLRSVGHGCFQRAVGVVSNTALGTGGAVHRMGGRSEFVDHGHHAAFRREAFEAVGGYDETFAAAEDAELDHRLAALGARIWFASDIVVDYYPRDTPVKLAKQYYRNGLGRAQAVLKHRKIRLRQMAPPVFLIALGLSLPAALAWPPALLAPGAYLAFCLSVATYLAVKEKSLCMLAIVAIAPIIHLCWAAGFLRSLLFGAPPRRAAAIVDPA